MQTGGVRWAIAVLMLLPLRAPALEAAHDSGTEWIVQLGAYESVELLDAAWQDIVQRHGRTIGGVRIVRSEAVVGGHHYYRLALAGFDDLNAALERCERIRAEGGACYVRRDDP